MIDGECWAAGDDDPGNACRWCAPGTDAYAWLPKPGGTSCDDGDACTQLDACTGGQCVGADPVVCQQKSACHDVGTCDPDSGACDHPTKASGTPCDDGDLCTADDVCSAGTCDGTPAVTCTAGECEADSACDPATGACVVTAEQNGTQCDDGLTSTGDDACYGGVCVGVGCECTGENTCCKDCLPQNENKGCADDGLSCTKDVCKAGQCTHDELVPGECLIAGTCYVQGYKSSACKICEDADPFEWSTPGGLNEQACNDKDDDCDGVTDETNKPAPVDGWESNNAIESAEALGSMGACPQPSPDTQCGTVSATFHASDTADYYRWSMGNMPGGFWRCEVTNADPGMKFGLFVGYRRSGDPELPYVWMSNICPLMSEGSSCAAQILLPTYGPDPWTMYAGVWPMGGEDDCSYEYELECRLSFDEG